MSWRPPRGTRASSSQRQYYVSSGYNAEQAVAGFLPVEGGSIVVYFGHAFTDQVAGFGGAMKRNIGRRIMTETLTKLFDTNRGRLNR